MHGNRAFYWALASAAAMVLGGFGPWATVLVFSVSGTGGDGWVPIVGGLAAGALLAVKRTTLRWPPVTTALLGLAGLVVAGADLADVSSLASKTDEGLLSGAVSPGWGFT